MGNRFVVVDTTGRAGYPPEALSELDGLDTAVVPASPRNRDELIAACRDADVILVTAAHVTREVLEALPRLKGVVRYGVGLDRIDLDAAAARGVAVANVLDFCTDEVADHAVALLLACARDLVSDAEATRNGRWGRDTSRPRLRLSGRCAGVIGFGAIGRAVAGRLRALGMDILAHDPCATPAQAVACRAELVDLGALLSRADVISIHCSLTPATRHLLGPAQFALMKRNAILINTARGGVIDEAALSAALQSGRIAAAGLDVLEQEPPPPDHPLLAMNNVIVTPHVAWLSEESARDLVVGAFAQIARILRPLAPATPASASDEKSRQEEA